MLEIIRLINNRAVCFTSQVLAIRVFTVKHDRSVLARARVQMRVLNSVYRNDVSESNNNVISKFALPW